jgi:hypothetical protein
MSNSASGPGSDQEEWASLLEQLRKQPPAHPQPFFYARVQARLATQLAPVGPWLPDWVRRPAYVALVGLLVLAVSGDGVALRQATAADSYSTYPPGQPASMLPSR